VAGSEIRNVESNQSGAPSRWDDKRSSFGQQNTYLSCSVVSSAITDAPAMDESPYAEPCELSNVMDAPLVEPPFEDAGVSRAREILGSMKLKRESFSSALQSSRQHQNEIVAKNPFVGLKQQLNPTPFSSEEETTTITKQLNLSLQEKRERLSRMATSYGSGGAAAAGDTGGDAGFEKMNILKEIPFNHPVSLGGSSPRSCSGSIMTHETRETTGSGSFETRTGLVSTDASVASAAPAHEQHSSPNVTAMKVASSPPTLDNIREAFVEIPVTSSTSTEDTPAAFVETPITTSTSTDEDTPAAFVEIPVTKSTSTEDTIPTIVSSSDSSSAAASASCSVKEDETRSIPATAVMRPLDEGIDSPPEIRRVTSFNVLSPTQQIRKDLDIPTVIRSTGSWDSEISNSKTTALVSPRPLPICLSTKEGRAAYIESLYASGNIKLIEPPTTPASSHKGPQQTPSRSPNRTASLNSRSSLNSVSSPSTLSSHDAWSMHSHDPNAEEQLPPYIISGIYHTPPRNQTQLSPSASRPTSGSSRRERPGNQISVERYSPSRASPDNLSTGSGASDSDDMLDLSVVVRDQEKRRKYLASIKVARSPAQVSQLEDSDFIVSDDSSFDCSTDSNTSGWVSGDDSFTDCKTDNNRRQESVLSLSPMIAKGAKSQAKHKYYDESSVEPVLFSPQRESVDVDVTCVTTGGMYSLALASGLTKRTRVHVTVGRKRSSPMRLSNDFRCGTNGSHYDLALRSGLDLSVPVPAPIEKESEECWEGRGGLYDLAILSGLNEAIEARTPFTVQIGAPTDTDDDTVASERRTDYECGAGGSLFLAMESGATYTAIGSMYYMASQSGFRPSSSGSF
jgi:hypothetical protein